jgi:hypothetical protein
MHRSNAAGNTDGSDAGCCGADCTCAKSSTGPASTSSVTPPPGGIDGVKDDDETDVDCGGASAPKCAVGQGCKVDSDCVIACNYVGTCVGAPSCKPHLGGDTCGTGEEGQPSVEHESCCRSLPVAGYKDPTQAGKTVYVDKYEITAGRVRAWVDALAAANNGVPDVKGWIAKHRPGIWNTDWEKFLPSDYEGGTLTIARRLLGDPRPEDAGETGPPATGVILPPATDQSQHLGINYQFGPEVYVDLHGADCGTWDGSYAFSTFWYSPDIQKRAGQMARADGLGYLGETIPAKELLDVKSMNCMTNAMFAAFCAWDGGQLATDEVLDYITDSPASLGSISGCGPQIDDHGELLGNIFDHTVRSGGRCAPAAVINATFDAGDNLPVPGSILNIHNYHYPDLGDQAFDKAWEVSAPGRVSLATGSQADQIRINPGDEPWVDLHGNLSESALDMSGATFTGLFAMKYRGIGYGSARSDLNMTLMKGESILRLQRPEAKGAYIGARCMRFK